MKYNAIKAFVTDHTISGADDDNLSQTGLQEFKDSPAYYERRSKIGTKLGRGDWSIAIGVYLIIISVALVIL